MTEIVLNEIRDAMRSGAKLSIGRSYYGRTRLKIVQGPFGIRCKRINIDAQDLQKLYDSIKLRRVAA